jgi:hypothetical protein
MTLLLLLACTGDEPSDKQPSPDSPVDTVDSEPAPSVCQTLELSENPFQEGGSDDAVLYSTVADVTLQTTEGTWTLSEQWTGCDNYLFIPSHPNQGASSTTELWEKKKDFKTLFENLPVNTQLVFVVSSGKEEDRLADLADLKDKIDDTLSGLGQDQVDWWTPRVVYGTAKAGKNPGWLGNTLTTPNWGAGVDRWQRLRYIGSFANPERYNGSWFDNDVSMAANEPVYWNYEYERQESLDADGATVVRVWDSERIAGNIYAEVELPSKEEMEGFDTLTLDVTQACEGDGEYGVCPAWDYTTYMWVCSTPDEENPWADTPCEVEVDTQVGQCNDPDGDTHEGTYTCKEDGSGYEDMDCGCETEIGRWITTYHREGRYVHDASPLLPMLAEGGTTKFRFYANGPYELTADLRLSNSGEDVRPEEMIYLFAGGDLAGGTYNERDPVTVMVPSDAARVELVTVTTGHGMASPGNCAEFCDIHHEYTFNDDTTLVLDQPWVGDNFGCQAQIPEGTVPNQYGTWWYGRGGWCPGKQVDVERNDVTAQLKLGQDNTITYQAMYQGEDAGGGDNWQHIILNSWLVVYR